MKNFQVIINRKKQKIEGGLLDCFLLEKTRIIHNFQEKSRCESNFRVFYLIFEEFPEEIRRNLGFFDENMKKMESWQFEILKTEVSLGFFAEEEGFYRRILKYFGIFGLKEAEIIVIFKILSIILHLSEYHRNKGDILMKISEILEIQREKLENFCDSFNENQLFYLISEIYLQLFKGIVKKININLIKDLKNAEISTLSTFKSQFISDLSSNSQKITLNFIDILGFESLEINGIYQLSMNYLNEKIQQFYIENLYKSEEIEFLMEGLLCESSQLNFVDNLHILDIYEKKEGFQGFLQEIEEKLAKGENQEEINKNFFMKVEKMVKNDKNDTVFINKKAESFMISHSAMEIEYKYENFSCFLKKNLLVYQVFEEILTTSKNPLFSNFLSKKTTKLDKNISFFESLAEKINLLLKSLANCDKHYMNCLSSQKTLNSLDISQQIQVFHCENLIKFKKEVFSIKKTYNQFYHD